MCQVSAFGVIGIDTSRQAGIGPGRPLGGVGVQERVACPDLLRFGVFAFSMRGCRMACTVWRYTSVDDALAHLRSVRPQIVVNSARRTAIEAALGGHTNTTIIVEEPPA